MVQSGISYAAGQLLAVVAPRTVMVVDAPTDWSLAGPLWELALDEAPVDEILDILIRRGIRTSPSFAIVRIEGEAVRALVRGNVPVCFERAGEPVRLDATGATTWLEGLISGARRVLVGAVDSAADLPYVVSTGVVLVSGLALPCTPAIDSGSTEAPAELADVEPSGRPEVEPVAAGPAVIEVEPLNASGRARPEPIRPEPIRPEPARPVTVPVSAEPMQREPVSAVAAEPFAAAGAFAMSGAITTAEPEPHYSESDYSESDYSEPDYPELDYEAPPSSSRPALATSLASGSLPVIGAEPRIVDLSRAGGRNATYAGVPEARSFAPAADPSVPPARGLGGLNGLNGLNGHRPSVLEPEPDVRIGPSARSGGLPPYSPAGPIAPGAPGFPADDTDVDEQGNAGAGTTSAPYRIDDARDLAGDFAPNDIDDAPVDPDHAPADLNGADADHRRTEPFSDELPPFDRLLEPSPPWSASPLAEPLDHQDADEIIDLQAAEQADAERRRAAQHGSARGGVLPDEAAPVARAEPVESFDDLLIDPADGARPRGPSPADLPNFDPPSVSLPLPSALSQPSPLAPDSPARGSARPGPVYPYRSENPTPQSSFGAPAAWPPAPAAEPPAREGRGDRPEYPGRSSSFFAAPEAAGPATPAPAIDDPWAPPSRPPAVPPRQSFRAAEVPRLRPLPPPGEASNRSAPSGRPVPPGQLVSPVPAEPPPVPAEESFQAAQADPAPESDLDALPFRVRGQSLRPEQREGSMGALNGSRMLGPSDPASPFNPAPADGVGLGVNGHPANGSGANGANGVGGRAENGSGVSGFSDSGAPVPPPVPSGGLLLPAFFRGARAARKSGPEAPAAPNAREGSEPAWPGAGNPSPAAWVPPVRRGQLGQLGSRNPSGPGGPGGPVPPAMPGALRGSGDDGRTATPTPAGLGAAAANLPQPHREPPRLLGVWCDAGHVTSPDRDECRVCGLKVPSQAPILVARPPLGVLIFDNGDRVDVDRPVILGRDPKPISSPDPEPPVLHGVPSATGQVSRTHAEIRASGWDVVLTDLDAMNGTSVTLPGRSPVAIEPGVPTVIVPGSRVDLGGESGLVFEIDG